VFVSGRSTTRLGADVVQFTDPMSEEQTFFSQSLPFEDEGQVSPLKQDTPPDVYTTQVNAEVSLQVHLHCTYRGSYSDILSCWSLSISTSY
jgi:hypothetical protein